MGALQLTKTHTTPTLQAAPTPLPLLLIPIAIALIPSKVLLLLTIYRALILLAHRHYVPMQLPPIALLLRLVALTIGSLLAVPLLRAWAHQPLPYRGGLDLLAQWGFTLLVAVACAMILPCYKYP